MYFVVGEVVEDFYGEEEVRRGDILVLCEDGVVDDFDFVGVVVGFGGGEEVVFLYCGEGGGDFDDVEFCLVVYLGIDFLDVI